MQRRTRVTTLRASGVARRDVLRGAAAFATLSALAVAPSYAGAASAGEAAPELSARGESGPLTLVQHRGRVVWLDFWASWCAPCRLSFPWMDAMQARYGGQGLQVIAINLDARPEAARRFLSETPASFTIGYDATGDTARRYSVKAMPTSVLIAHDGRVIATHAGFRDSDRDRLEAVIREAIARRTAASSGGGR